MHLTGQHGLFRDESKSVGGSTRVACTALNSIRHMDLGHKTKDADIKRDRCLSQHAQTLTTPASLFDTSTCFGTTHCASFWSGVDWASIARSVCLGHCDIYWINLCEYSWELVAFLFTLFLVFIYTGLLPVEWFCGPQFLLQTCLYNKLLCNIMHV